MRKLLLCLGLCLGLALFGAGTAQAYLVHEAVYHWQSGGTIVNESTPSIGYWKVGSPVGWSASGNHNFDFDKVQIWEKAHDVTNDRMVEEDPQSALYKDYYQSGEVGKFNWTVSNDNFFTTIYSFHVPNGGQELLDHKDPTGWTFSEVGSWFVWETDSSGDALGKGDALTFSVIVPISAYWISTAGVDDVNGNWYDESGTWVTSHPAPEPSSMLLLGMGLFGLAGGVVRKRFKA